jgi:hypothetical protein
MFVPFDPADFVGTNKRRQIYSITKGLEKERVWQKHTENEPEGWKGGWKEKYTVKTLAIHSSKALTIGVRNKFLLDY